MLQLMRNCLQKSAGSFFALPGENVMDENNQKNDEAAGKVSKKAVEETTQSVIKGGSAVQKTLLVQKIVIGVMAVLIVGGGIAALGMHYGWFGKNAAQEAKPTADIDPNSDDWDGTIPDAPKGDPTADSIAIPGYPQIYITPGQKDVDVAFANPEGNPCFFTFQLVLKDSQEVLYESKQVPPGEAIKTATLSRPLDAGEYAAVLKISTNSIADMSEMNGANMETTLKVQ